MTNMFGDWLLTGVIIALFVMLTSILQWQSKRLSKLEWKEMHLMNLWMNLVVLQSVTDSDEELGKELRKIILRGVKNKELEKHIESIKQKGKN